MPRNVVPIADVDPGGFVNETDGTSLWDHLSSSSGEFVHARRRFVDGPQRILFLTTDDGMRRNGIDHTATITTCVDPTRVGQLARQNTHDRITAVGQSFDVARTDHSPCSPGRAAFMCGDRSLTHANTKVLDTEYYDHIRDGTRTPQVYNNDQKLRGPIERDCAILAAEAFFANVNTSAAAWNSGTAYVLGNQVSRSLSGKTHFFIAQKSGTNKPPESNCDGTADFWRHYGTLNAATLMRAQQVCPIDEQPYAGDLAGASKRRTHWYGRATGLNSGAIGGLHSEDDLQKTGGWNLWLSYTGEVKCYGLEKHQNLIGIPASSDPVTAYMNPDPGPWTYWAAGTYTAGTIVAYNGYFYTCSSNVTSSTPPPSDGAHWGAGVASATTSHVAPGWRRAIFSADDNQDHYRNSHIDFDELIGGPNPATNVDGQIGVNSLLQYDWPISTLTYNSGTNKVTVVTVSPIPNIAVNEVLDISVDYPSEHSTATPIGGSHWVEPEISATCTVQSGTQTTFTFTPTATPTGTPNVTNAFVYIRKFYEPVWYTDQHIAMLDDVSAYDNIIVYHGFHNPHWSTNPTGGVIRSDLETMNERRYENSLYSAVDLAQAWRWNGVSGGYQPSVSATDAASSTLSSGRKHWASRQNMFASQDDAIGRLLDAWDAKFGVGGYYVIIADDNGYQYSSHHNEESAAEEPVGGKVWTWENSVRVQISCVGPEFTPGTSSRILVELADIPLTILDIMGKAIPSLLTHHAHTKRDGTSIIRKLATVGGWTNHHFARGAYLTGAGTGASISATNHVKVYDHDGNALARKYQSNNVIETGTAAAWVSGGTYTVGQQVISAGRFYTCIVNVTGSSTAPLSDVTHWSDQYRRLFLAASPGQGEPDPIEDETVDHTFDNGTTQALGDSLATTLSALMVGYWHPETATHTGKI